MTLWLLTEKVPDGDAVGPAELLNSLLCKLSWQSLKEALYLLSLPEAICLSTVFVFVCSFFFNCLCEDAIATLNP